MILDPAAEVLFESRGSLGIITLNRPKALNALTLEMIRELQSKLKAWRRDDAIGAVVVQGAGDRAFCAGGDIRAIVTADAGPETAALKRDFFREEYILNHLVHHFGKPYLALLDGVTMGGGVGISAHGRYRLTTERTLLAMPETGIGLFPDVGATWFLNRCPGEIGLYLGLTGARLHAADVIAAGIGTHHLASARLPELIDTLAAEAALTPAVIDRIVGRLASDPGPATLSSRRAEIDRIFDAVSVEEIVARLAGEHDAWAAQAAASLDRASPTSLKVTFRQLREGRHLDIAQALVVEYRMSQHFMAGSDFYEGVRATLIDKDNAPRWVPATLAEVDEARVAGYFQPLGGDDLHFV